MPDRFMDVDLSRVRQLRPFKFDYRRLRRLEYRSPSGRTLQTQSSYESGLGPALQMKTEQQPRPSFSEDLRYLRDYSAQRFPKGKMAVVVNWDLYPQIQAGVDQYIRDLAYEGFFATAYRIQGGSAKELRSFLRTISPVGVVMVGRLPVAWYYLSDGGLGNPSEFPCDLYYMDLNGTWSDMNLDGRFEHHGGTLGPEIWMGRLWTSFQDGNDATALNDYFARNHQFRKGQLGYSNRALAFVDDEFVDHGDCAMDCISPSIQAVTVNDPDRTWARHYLADANQHLAWLQVCVHGESQCHSFITPQTESDWVMAADVRANPPDAYFYNLYSCAVGWYTIQGYMAGAYLFSRPGASRPNGMALVACTKAGSLEFPENFYSPMAQGKTIGEAFVEWWSCLGSSHDLWERQAFYGLTLLGDPTLNWWYGVVPELNSPYEADVFIHSPHTTHFSWKPIGLPDVKYRIQIDGFGSVAEGQWETESGGLQGDSGWISETHYRHLLKNTGKGRWRVQAKVGTLICPWTDWRYFSYQ